MSCTPFVETSVDILDETLLYCTNYDGSKCSQGSITSSGVQSPTLSRPRPLQLQQSHQLFWFRRPRGHGLGQFIFRRCSQHFGGMAVKIEHGVLVELSSYWIESKLPCHRLSMPSGYYRRQIFWISVIWNDTCSLSSKPNSNLPTASEVVKSSTRTF